MSELWPPLLTRLLAGEDLTADEAVGAMAAIMDGEATPAQIAAFVVALRAKGETSEEIEGLARTMLDRAVPVPTSGPVVDTCGTGGDRAGTLNVSTIAAVVVAGAGVPVAKHGNRAASSRCGSADLLEALGVKIDLDAAGVTRCIEQAGIGFMFAPVFHPAMAHTGVPRREMGIPTVFNFLGPLTNPARPVAQVVGVSDPRMQPKLAGVLGARGTRAMVVRGHDGLDELTTTGPSVVYDVRDGAVSETTVDPAALGLAPATAQDLVGGDVERNVSIAYWVLDGEHGPARDIVVLNAAAALHVAGRAASLEDGLSQAAEAIDSKAAREALTRWVEVSNAS
jgi:anthranilate phosphoribosyltransferase